MRRGSETDHLRRKRRPADRIGSRSYDAGRLESTLGATSPEFEVSARALHVVLLVREIGLSWPSARLLQSRQGSKIDANLDQDAALGPPIRSLLASRLLLFRFLAILVSMLAGQWPDIE